MGLKWRLTLGYTLVLFFIMMVVAVMYVRGAREDVRAEIQSTRLVVEHFIDLERGAIALGRGESGFDLNALRTARHLRVEFVDDSGKVIETNRYEADRGRHEVPEWFAKLASPSQIQEPIRKPIVEGGQRRGELILAPDPSNEIAEKWDDTKELALFSFLLFIGVNAVVYVVVARSLRPIDRIVDMLREIEEGNLQARLPTFTVPEFDRIGVRFNGMAGALERSAGQNQRLTSKLIRVQDEEQRRLARELHDELGQSVTAIQVDAAAIMGNGQQNALLLESATAIIEVAQRMHRIIRGELHRLRPESLEDFGLVAALRELVDAWQRRNPTVTCTFDPEENLDIQGGETALTIYRGVQEALTNVARHSMATKVDIQLRKVANGRGDRLMLAVRDNGRGMTPAPKEHGFGLLGMRERAASLGGSLAIPIDAQPGFRFELELPAGTAVAFT